MDVGLQILQTQGDPEALSRIVGPKASGVAFGAQDPYYEDDQGNKIIGVE